MYIFYCLLSNQSRGVSACRVGSWRQIQSPMSGMWFEACVQTPRTCFWFALEILTASACRVTYRRLYELKVSYSYVSFENSSKLKVKEVCANF